MFISPSTEGAASISVTPEAFLRAFAQRLAGGLLSGVSPNRNRYLLTKSEPRALRFHADGWPTAFNVGLNDVDLTLQSATTIHYRIRFMRWACYSAALGAAVGLSLIAFLVLFDVRTYIEQHPGPEYLGLSPEQNVAIAWAMALFWGFAGPWILVAMHKRPLRELMNRLIAEVDASARQTV